MNRLIIDVFPTDWSPKKTILHFITGPDSILNLQYNIEFSMAQYQNNLEDALEKQRIKSKTIGNYVLGKTLGKGTFGKVKLAQQILTGQKVAIKILEKDRIIDVADVQRVSREIHILKLIRHPSIIQLYQIIETPKQLFLVMEYMQNGELFDYIVKNKKISQQQACKFFQQIIGGVEYIHKLNIVHRDLKPENLLLDYDNSIRIVDFGLSNTYKKDQRLKTACGSPCYAAPEMIEGKKKYEALLVDIWSCGVILFAMLCGSLPFEDPETSKLYQKILSGQYKIPKYLSSDAKDLISKILTVDPEKRIRIEEIKRHRWWSLASNNIVSEGIIVGYNRIPIQTEILERLKVLEFDVDLARKCIESNRHNHLSTSYYLLLKKFIRQGGISKADLGSKYFDKNLIEPNKRREKSLNKHQALNSSSGQELMSKQDNKFNFLSLLKGKNNPATEGESKELLDIKQQNDKNNKLTLRPQQRTRRLYEQIKIPTSTKRGRSPVKDTIPNQNIRNKYKEKYSSSLVSRSTEKTRNNSLKYNETIIKDERFRQYQMPEPRRTSITSKGHKKPNSLHRPRDNSQPSCKDSNNKDEPDFNRTYLIGGDTVYEKHQIPKWKNAITIDTKEVARPYINRRAHHY